MVTNVITRKSWNEFRESKMLWWVNRLIHTFGWAIVFDTDENGAISDVYPARVKFRGFSIESEDAGFQGLTNHLANTIDELKSDVNL